MQRFLLTVDKLSTFFGQLFSWLIVALTLLITWEVYSRYVAEPAARLGARTLQIMLYGTLFMMAGAYTLAKNDHVRGDVLYGFFQPRTQASGRPVLYIVFFLPGIVALTYAGWTYANDALAIREQTFSADAAADLSVQVRDPGRRRAAAAAGHRRDHPLRGLPS